MVEKKSRRAGWENTRLASGDEINMRYFLDTNILIFHALGGEDLNKEVKSIFDDYENLIYVSSEVVK
jgi:hypothetical protein